MKKILLLSTFLFVVSYSFAQKEVAILNKKPAFITELSSPLTGMQIDIDDDYTSYFSKIEVKDSTMVFRTAAEYSSYINKYDKAMRDRTNSTKPKNTPLPDATLYLVKNRELLRPGLEIDIYFEEYRISQRNIARYIVILTKMDGNDTYTGVYEGITDNRAVIDGKSVTLKEGAFIEGTEGFKGQRFQSFQNMMIGSFVQVSGKRQPSGILLVEKGKAWENKESPDDAKLKVSLQTTMKVTSSEVSFGNMKFKMLKNADLSNYVSQVGRSVIPAYQKELPNGHPVKIDFNFYVVEDSTFNACAYPDGSVFVHTALLAQLDNEAQLATILGHEISHVTYEHARVQFRVQQNIAIGAAIFTVFAVVAGVAPVDVAVLVAAFGGVALSSSYNRKLEEQADRAGLNYMFQAGYDPREAGKVWKKMKEITSAAESHYGANMARATEKGINSIYATHPSALKRYKNVNRLIALNYHEEDLTVLKVNQPVYRSKMKAMNSWLKGTAYYEPEVRNNRDSSPAASTTTSKQPKKTNKKTNAKAALPVTKK